MTYRLTSAALVELREAALYYNSREIGLGLRFVEAVEEAIQRVIAAPEAWRPLSINSRRCLVHFFPYGVVCQIKRNEILVVAILDLRRDPKMWRKLL